MNVHIYKNIFYNNINKRKNITCYINKYVLIVSIDGIKCIIYNKYTYLGTLILN